MTIDARASASSASREEGLRPGQETGTTVVLLVEDNPADAELLGLRLLEPSTWPPSGMPLRLLPVDSAAAACAVLRDTTVDMVILDLSLPDAHGLAALHRVRAESADVPIVVLTGSADEALALEALRAGAQDYVLKPPPDGRTLRRILRYAQERQQLRKELDVAVQVSARAARHWRLLAEAAGVLATPDLSGEAVAQVAGLVVPETADCFALLVLGDTDEGVPAIAEAAHVDGVQARALRERLDALLAASAGAVSDPLLDLIRAGDLASGEAETPPAPLLASLGMDSGCMVRLPVGGTVRGVVVVAAAPARRDRVDAEFTRFISDRLALALERGRLLRLTQRAVTARDRTLGIVSHDLRNALHTVQICAKAILDPDPQPARGIRNMAEIIQRSAAWMQQIVQDLLDRASLDAGRLVLHRRPTAIPDLVSSVTTMLAPVAEQAELKFAAIVDPGLPLVDADPDRLLQVLANLLGNALKFTPPGGTVTLAVNHVGQEDAVRLTVSDTGPGISASDLPHVFDWFWQSPTHQWRGAGLGLAIAQGLVEAHSSKLYVESLPGRGSSFWFSIPAARPDATPGARPEP